MPVVSKYLTLHQRPMIHPHPWIPNNGRKKIVHLFIGPRKHFSPPSPHRELLNNFRPPIDSHFKILPLMLKTSWNFFALLSRKIHYYLGLGATFTEFNQNYRESAYQRRSIFLSSSFTVAMDSEKMKKENCSASLRLRLSFSVPPPSLATAIFRRLWMKN